jgi:hypothetical protein
MSTPQRLELCDLAMAQFDTAGLPNPLRPFQEDFRDVVSLQQLACTHPEDWDTKKHGADGHCPGCASWVCMLSGPLKSTQGLRQLAGWHLTSRKTEATLLQAVESDSRRVDDGHHAEAHEGLPQVW